jgi:hypothetical protein
MDIPLNIPFFAVRDHFEVKGQAERFSLSLDDWHKLQAVTMMIDLLVALGTTNVDTAYKGAKLILFSLPVALPIGGPDEESRIIVEFKDESLTFAAFDISSCDEPTAREILADKHRLTLDHWDKILIVTARMYLDISRGMAFEAALLRARRSLVRLSRVYTNIQPGKLIGVAVEYKDGSLTIARLLDTWSGDEPAARVILAEKRPLVQICD